MATTVAKHITDKQRDLIKHLCEERGLCVDKVVASRFGRDMTLDQLTGGRNGQASDLIAFLFDQGRGLAGTTPAKAKIQPGLYQVGSMAVKITVGRSGQWYAQRAKRTPLGFKWEYLGRRIDMRGARLLDPEVVEAFVKETGLE
ncbi:hypothetical protein SEA_LITTLELAF_102 [Mycobacterium phage LittleLaf]|uniref:Uncharacterized protein n=10 Tax=Marvinvirus TaxID=1982091 RepID=A0A482MFH5_9CAUD|nr:hypothetical protein FH33_gp102 [Mycobacterium phage MosMoris]YP_009614218.1 hypothetical protein FDI61_gp100 [Mycobacterium phage Marvin]ANM46327.1 hypothetical protein SEA_GATTACA_105 [Mycobacterium phage Gattaca]AVE00848.1 hypothetical protein SEA_TESLA_102 [Mycobacterium phage Tesla]AYB69906.1 hypothetical protein SEA_LITTLELAF_102 [Mycobacterium phage LittleLaf]QAX93157.1 hypothetical protein SEA_REDRAIDER77_106 [Mycobacterium phage RedRaider77]QBQ71397.1 hypothetical protein SEA_BLAC